MPENSETLLATEATPEPTEQQADDVTSLEQVTPEEQPQDQGESPDSAETEDTAESPEEAPESYEFTNPEAIGEDTAVDSRILDAYSEASRELGLPQDKAQAMFDRTMSAFYKAGQEEHARRTKEMVDAVRSDPELSAGDAGQSVDAKIDANRAIALKAIDKFGTDGLRELLSDPNVGIGNHPEVFRLLLKVGNAIAEDRFVGSESGPGGDPNDDGAIAAKLYPTSRR